MITPSQSRNGITQIVDAASLDRWSDTNIRGRYILPISGYERHFTYRGRRLSYFSNETLTLLRQLIVEEIPDYPKSKLYQALQRRLRVSKPKPWRGPALHVLFGYKIDPQKLVA